jgi:hypothetical protein
VALNLWKIGGMATSFNPLPTGFTSANRVDMGIGNFTVRFRAKSNTSATLRVVDSTTYKWISKDYILTSDFKSYETSFSISDSSFGTYKLYLYDANSVGNIIIANIELVQKPLPKLTLNGVDGFLSGKWTLHANAVVVDDETLILNATAGFQQSQLSVIPVQGGQTVTFSQVDTNGVNRWDIDERDQNNVQIGDNVTFTGNKTWVLNANTRFLDIKATNNATGTFTFKRPILNLGSTPAPHSRKTGDKMVLPVVKGNGVYQVNKLPKKTIVKARTGLAFNGVSDYLQLPSMTMDSVEIECLIDSVQLNSFPKLLDARTGLVNGYVNADSSQSFGADWLSVYGRVKGQRTKVKAIAKSVFTDNVNIFSSSSNIEFTKGILYNVTCYLNNQVVAQYDFENASNIVGSTVLQGANNLIPNFEDTRWSLYANTQVLGRNLLRLNATSTWQTSYFILSVTPNSSCYFSCNTNGQINLVNADTDAWISSTKGGTFSIPSNVTRLKVKLENTSSGSFDFIRPQLYVLDGTQGTLNGTPIPLNKRNKRVMYAKR